MRTANSIAAKNLAEEKSVRNQNQFVGPAPALAIAKRI